MSGFGRVNAFGIAVAATFDKQSGRTVDCKFLSGVSTTGTDGPSVE